MRNKYSSCVPRRKPSDFCQVGKSYVFRQMRRIAGRSCKRLNTQTRCRRNYSNARGILACGESVASLARTAGFLHSLYQIAGRTESTPRNLAEREGFEPPEAFTSTVFKTAALDRSAISPNNLYILTKGRGVVK